MKALFVPPLGGGTTVVPEVPAEPVVLDGGAPVDPAPPVVAEGDDGRPVSPIAPMHPNARTPPKADPTTTPPTLTPTIYPRRVARLAHLDGDGCNATAP